MFFLVIKQQSALSRTNLNHICGGQHSLFNNEVWKKLNP